MKNTLRTGIAALVALMLCAGAARAEDGDLAPANAGKTLDHLSYLCWTSSLCPLSAQGYRVLKKAVAGDRDGQYLWGLFLLTGDGVPTDRAGGMKWIAMAAEQGAPDAVMFVNAKIRNGERVEFDETKAATILKKQVGAGDVESMRALGPMMIRGRGTDQDVKGGIEMLVHAAQRGSAKAEQDLSDLYLMGAPGVPKDRTEAMRWLAVSAGHGNVDAMVNLGYMSMTAPIMDLDKVLDTGHLPPRPKTSLVAGYCWLMRAALMDNPQAQEKLSMMFSSGEHDDDARLAADLIQADYWFRLAARSPYHDNSQIRGGIEPKMTTAQLDQAKHLFETWHALKFDEMKAMTIAFPGGPNCPAMS